MTSTVLDVTLMLLCVSASVVALAATDPGAPDGPSAGDAADRLVTETTTVAYPDDDAPNGTRRVHATRAELLARLAERAAAGGGARPFDRRAVRAVRAGIGPRTRLAVSVERATRRPVDERFGGVPVRLRTRDPSARAAAADPTPARGSAAARRAGATVVTVGPRPPRDATVGVAVVRQPLPTAAFGSDPRDGDGPPPAVRIVVRRW